jgi:pectate lyase
MPVSRDNTHTLNSALSKPMKHLLTVGGLFALITSLVFPAIAQTAEASSPLLTDALGQSFWQQLDTNGAFKKELISKLATQAYRQIGPVPAVRVSLMPGHALESPSILLEYQTRFHGTINIQGGPFGGTCVQVPGGRDAYAHRTFYGGTEDTNARQQFLDLFAKRAKMPSNRRKDITPEFDALFAKYIPEVPFEKVHGGLTNLLLELVRQNQSAGATVLTNPAEGEFGVKLNANLYAYIRNFSKGSRGSRVESSDPYLWLILSGGPKPMPTKYLPAFPGAEGFGAMTTGGRGGKVIYVTTTNASGPGSFAEAVNTKGPRTVLFKVSGQIVLPKDVWIREPDLTLIGYNAPGEGVEICGRLCVAADNIIMRGMRWRLRPPLSADGSNTEGDLHNIIFDHCSFAYGSDEALRFIGETHTFWNYTLQYCIIGPGMAGLGTHPYGPEVGGVGSIHHCILNNALSRSPEVDCARLDWRNNLMYNLRSGHSKRLTSQFNFVNNLVIDNPEQGYSYSFGATANNYIDGNFRDKNGELIPFGPGASATSTEDTDGDFAPDPNEVMKQPWRVMPVTTVAAADLEKLLLPILGAYLPKRDTTDAHWMAGVATRTGKPAFWDKNDPNWKSYNQGSNDRDAFMRWDSAHFPPPAAGAVAATDTDGDGLPDDWELANKLDPKNPADGAADTDKDGYTNLEEYLNRTDSRKFVDYTNPVNNKHTLH